MPKLRCSCGHIINLSEIPNPNGFHVFSEARFDEIIGAAAKSLELGLSEDVMWEAFRKLFVPLQGSTALHMYQCGSCGRLAVLAHPSDDNVARWYRPDEVGGNTPFLSSLERSEPV